MSKVLCFGELLLRFLPAAGGEWLRTNDMSVFVGGAELNVATALARWNVPVKYFTVLPNNQLSKDILLYLEHKGVDASAVAFGGDRMGIYYLSSGADMKSAQTIFDRKDSSFSLQPTGQLDWDDILKDVVWFHFSAIAPALSESAAKLCKEAVEEAFKRKIRISVDLNYRSLLWKYGKQPVEIMPDLVRSCEVIMGNIWSAHTLLGAPQINELPLGISSDEYRARATVLADYLYQQYPSCKWVANTFRFDSDAENVYYYATLNHADAQSISPVFRTGSIVDKVGSGDCFMAGLIYGIMQQHSMEEVVGFAAAAAFGKLLEPGDSTKNSIVQVQQILSDFSK